jgi:hypothetical protein
VRPVIAWREALAADGRPLACLRVSAGETAFEFAGASEAMVGPALAFVEAQEARASALRAAMRALAPSDVRD